jgi:hypothetical protein
MIRYHPAASPIIMGMIHRSMPVMEQIEVGDYFNYLGPKETAPEASSYVRNSLQYHPSDPDSYIHTKHDGTSHRVKDENADKMADIYRRAYAKSIKTVADKLDSLYPESTPKEQKVINSYVKDSSINQRMIAGKLNPLEQKQVSNIKEVVRHPAPDNMVLYSGTNPEHADKLAKMDVVDHPSFLSTSISPNAARSFAQKDLYGKKQGAIMKIHVPKGFPTALVRGGDHDGEREVILPPNVKLKIDRSKEHVMVGPHGSVTVHHCEIVQ